jgi:predicted PurR-regulated permease PerM
MLVLIWLAWMLRDLAVVVGFAALLAYALEPVVSWIERIKLPGHRPFPRGVAAGLVILLLVLVAGASLAITVPRLAQQFVLFARAAPAALTRLQQAARAFVESHGWGGLLRTGEGDTGSAASSALSAMQRGLTSALGGVLGSLGGLARLILLPLFAFYILAGRERARASVLRMVPENRLPQAVRFLDALDRALRAYVHGQALVCLTMGTAVGLVLQLLGFPLALLLGVLVGLGEIIPYLGFWIAATAVALEGYSKSPGLAVAGVVGYMIINNLVGTFVSPRLLGRQVNLHPFVVNMAVIGGGMLLGPAGAILALPAAAVVKALLDEFGPRPRHGAASGAATGDADPQPSPGAPL